MSMRVLFSLAGHDHEWMDGGTDRKLRETSGQGCTPPHFNQLTSPPSLPLSHLLSSAWTDMRFRVIFAGPTIHTMRIHSTGAVLTESLRPKSLKGKHALNPILEKCSDLMFMS